MKIDKAYVLQKVLLLSKEASLESFKSFQFLAKIGKKNPVL